jgi:hypothetical protein
MAHDHFGRGPELHGDYVVPLREPRCCLPPLTCIAGEAVEQKHWGASSIEVHHEEPNASVIEVAPGLVHVSQASAVMHATLRYGSMRTVRPLDT